MDDLAPLEQNADPQMISLIDEFSPLLDLERDVMVVDGRPEADFLDVDDMLFFPAEFFLLAELVFIFSEIHHPADRGIRIGSDLHQVQLLFLGKRERLGDGKDSDLFAVGSDDADLAGFDLLIDPNGFFFNGFSSL